MKVLGGLFDGPIIKKHISQRRLKRKISFQKLSQSLLSSVNNFLDGIKEILRCIAGFLLEVIDMRDIIISYEK